MLASLWTWAGITCYILSFLSWIYVLRSVPLGTAFALISVAHVLIPLGSWAFLHEVIGPARWCGISLVVAGLAHADRTGGEGGGEAVNAFEIAIAICVVCQLLMVGGQILLKHAMTEPNAARPSALSSRVRNFTLAIACLTLWFFLWLGLMRRWDLSKLYPFEGLNPVLIALAAWLVLKERLPAKAWVGLVLVCVGIALVARS